MMTEGQQLVISTADEVKKDGASVVVPPPHTPGKRGRKPKKYLLQAPAATPSSVPAVTNPPKSRGRPPKHPKPVIVEGK